MAGRVCFRSGHSATTQRLRGLGNNDQQGPAADVIEAETAAAEVFQQHRDQGGAATFALAST